MNYNLLGKTGLKVSEICMGTMTFGVEADRDESKAMFQLCRDKGINLFDCANKYGDGKAESILGECVQDCRDEVILTTKTASRVGPGVNELGASRKHLMIELEKSLKRLKTDYIDLYFIHYFDPFTEIESTLRFLDSAIRQGKILYSGVSNWSAWQIMKSIHESRVNNLHSFDCIQPMYNLLKRQAEVEILPLAEDQHLGVVSYSPLGAGVLTGKYNGTEEITTARLVDKDYYNKRYQKKEYFETAAKLCAYAAEIGCNPIPMSIRWVMHHPAVTSPIIGARNKEQLMLSLEAVDVAMTDEIYNHISSLSEVPSPAHDRLEEVLDPQTRLR